MGIPCIRLRCRDTGIARRGVACGCASEGERSFYTQGCFGGGKKQHSEFQRQYNCATIVTLENKWRVGGICTPDALVSRNTIHNH